MNEQPYGTPLQHWPPKMTPWWFHLSGFLRRRALEKQRMSEVEVEGADQLARASDAGYGVMITPNHSFHWDSYCLLEAAVSLRLPFYFMSAWQVFAKSKWFERESMQRCGCFSVDREGTDVQSLKTAVDILQNRRHPLVVFPEGDVYHTNDRVTPFRDGAAAMALMAARKSDRPIRILPVAIKRWYVGDPSPSLAETLTRIEERLLLVPRRDLPLLERILRIAECLVALKETEHLKSAQTGTLTERIQGLLNAVLEKAEAKYEISKKSRLAPERIKEVRRAIIGLQERNFATATTTARDDWARDMHGMFLATQLFSYPGDYLIENPSIERLAETIDKLEEDILGVSYPTIHGERRVKVQFDAPIEVPSGKEKKMSPAELTDRMESRVQSMLDLLNREFTRS